MRREPMRKSLIALTLLAGLAACGVDGPPERPAAPRSPAGTVTSAPGVNVSGDIRIGVAGGL